jgi:hypothetical protein
VLLFAPAEAAHAPEKRAILPGASPARTALFIDALFASQVDDPQKYDRQSGANVSNS